MQIDLRPTRTMCSYTRQGRLVEKVISDVANRFSAFAKAIYTAIRMIIWVEGGLDMSNDGTMIVVSTVCLRQTQIYYSGSLKGKVVDLYQVLVQY